MKVRFRATEVTEYEFDTGDVSPAFIKQVLDEGKGFGPGDFHLQDFARGNLIRYDIEYVELESYELLIIEAEKKRKRKGKK